ncbi:hypothetical protein L7F22_020401 [Adiantum nelumboides]|nr:hypothetical protein [Adiantum nelumboides]
MVREGTGLLLLLDFGCTCYAYIPVPSRHKLDDRALPSTAVTWVAPSDPGAVAPHVPHPLPAPQAQAQLLAVPLPALVTQPATPAANRLSSSRKTTRSSHQRRSFTHLDYATTSPYARVPPPWDNTGPRSTRTRHLHKTTSNAPGPPPSTNSQPGSTHTSGPTSFSSEDLHIPSCVAHPNASTSSATQAPIIEATDDISSTAASTSPPLYAKTRSLTELYNATTPLQPPIDDESFAGSAMPSVAETPEDGDPVSVEAALSGPCADLWRQAMESELSSLQSNHTWSLVPLPHGRQPISCKWVLRHKLHPDGSVACYKARLVARGFSQIPGLDYSETFSPVLRMSSLRLLLAIAALFDLELYHLDVQTAFLHGELPEELYMQQPPHYESSAHPRYVCRLHRSIYGLKQSPRLWFKRFNDFMITHGYTRLCSEPNVYIRHNSFSFLAVALYVDDIPVLGSSKSVASEAVAQLKAAFPITDLGDLTYFLGLQIIRDRSTGTLLVHQSSYVDNLLKEFGPADLKPSHTPLPTGCKLSLSDSPIFDSDKAYMTQYPYRQLIGKMRYLVTGTRLDICHAWHRPQTKEGFVHRCIWCDSTDHGRKDCDSFLEALKRRLIFFKDGKIHLTETGLPMGTNFGKGGMKKLVDDMAASHAISAVKAASYGLKVEPLKNKESKSFEGAYEEIGDLWPNAMELAE